MIFKEVRMGEGEKQIMSASPINPVRRVVWVKSKSLEYAQVKPSRLE